MNYPSATAPALEQLARETILQTLEANVVAKAQECFTEDRAVFLGFSGKMGSGKDTVAPLVCQELGFQGDSIRTDSFSANLKQELNELIVFLQSENNSEQAAAKIAGNYQVPELEALKVVNFIHREIQEGELQRSSDRTTGCRRALQYWATEIRRAQDPFYWVKPVVQRALEAAVQGVSTCLTDVRFFTEAWGILSVGGKVVRLDVSQEEQARRIVQRDGLRIAEEARLHSSETELDSFEGFTLRVTTDTYSSPLLVAQAVASAL